MRHRTSAFGRRLAAIAVLGLTARLAYVLLVFTRPPAGDGSQFTLLARLIADGRGYLQLYPWLTTGASVPSAEKPPLYPAYLALSSFVVGESDTALRVASVIAGTVAVIVIGLLGRRVAGPRVGLLAAGIAALSPVLVVLDGSLRSESLYVLLIAGALLATYRLRDEPRVGTAVAAGAVIGLAALTRSEALALLVLLVPWAVGRRRWAMGAVAVLATLVVIAPWVARSWATFDRPVLISTNVGGLLAGANCDRAYNGDLIGSWPCLVRATPALAENEAAEQARLRDQGIRYAVDHAGRLPAVVVARVARTWELYYPWSVAPYEATIGDRSVALHRAGLLVLGLTVPLAALGAVLLRARSWPLLAIPLLVTVVSALTYGSSRFRAAADVALVVLAAVAIGALLDRRARSSASATPASATSATSAGWRKRGTP